MMNEASSADLTRAEPHGLDASGFDEVARRAPFITERSALSAYARATNDSNEVHLSGAVASPLFAVVPALKTMVGLRKRLYGGFVLHAEHDIFVHRPIVPGMRLTVEARLHSISPSPVGAVIVVKGVTRTEAGDRVNEQFLVQLAQSLDTVPRIGTPPPDHRMPAGLTETAPHSTWRYAVDPDQTLRYAEASGDRDAYTFDDEAAREKGLPGAIVHGLCTMAFVGRAIVEGPCGGDSRRLRRLAVRFSKLLLLRDARALETRIWRDPRSPESAFACEAAGNDGTVVIRHGRAEIET